MKPAPFAYARARSREHAIELLAQQEGARVLAGGQSLIATLNMRLDAPKLLVDINAIGGLDGIARRNSSVEIGALVRQASAMRSPIVADHAPLLARALPHVGHPATRNRGTIGGSIAFADPAAELPACLLALDGEVDIAGPHGTRTVKADDFFLGLFETALGPHDLLTAIRVPAAGPDMRYAFAELARRHGDYAIVGLAACARLDGGGLHDVRLVYFGVGATAVSARRAAAALAGGARDDARLDHAVAALGDDLDPADDVQATGKTKHHLAGVLLRRVVRELSEPVQ